MVEHHLDMVVVGGSIPLVPTICMPRAAFLMGFLAPCGMRMKFDSVILK